MDIDVIVLDALKPVLNNTWSVELPPNPVFPAAVFEIESSPENNWSTGGAFPAYEQHTVAVVVMAKTKTQLKTLMAQANVAMQAIAGYLQQGDSGDAQYEDDASVYGYYTNHIIRTQRY